MSSDWYYSDTGATGRGSSSVNEQAENWKQGSCSPNPLDLKIWESSRYDSYSLLWEQSGLLKQWLCLSGEYWLLTLFSLSPSSLLEDHVGLLSIYMLPFQAGTKSGLPFTRLNPRWRSLEEVECLAFHKATEDATSQTKAMILNYHAAVCQMNTSWASCNVFWALGGLISNSTGIFSPWERYLAKLYCKLLRKNSVHNYFYEVSLCWDRKGTRLPGFWHILFPHSR